MREIAVYRCEVRDHRLSENVVGPQMATRETITRIKAAALLGTEKLVEECEPDASRLPFDHQAKECLRELVSKNSRFKHVRNLTALDEICLGVHSQQFSFDPASSDEKLVGTVYTAPRKRAAVVIS